MPANRGKEENFVPQVKEENQKADEVLETLNGNISSYKGTLKKLVSQIEEYTEKSPDEIFRVDII